MVTDTPAGPAALGLTTTLLALHLSPAQVRRRLLIFSLAAPVGALVTYALVAIFGSNSGHATGKYSLGWWTGVALLFSVSVVGWIRQTYFALFQRNPDVRNADALFFSQGGSFLYVATVIQPISKTGPDDHCHDVHHEVHKRDKPEIGHIKRMWIILLGMALPLAMSSLVSHHH